MSTLDVSIDEIQLRNYYSCIFKCFYSHSLRRVWLNIPESSVLVVALFHPCVLAGLCHGVDDTGHSQLCSLENLMQLCSRLVVVSCCPHSARHPRHREEEEEEEKATYFSYGYVLKYSYAVIYICLNYYNQFHIVLNHN